MRRLVLLGNQPTAVWRLGQAGGESVLLGHSLAEMGARYESIYEQVTGRGRGETRMAVATAGA